MKKSICVLCLLNGGLNIPFGEKKPNFILRFFKYLFK